MQPMKFHRILADSESREAFTWYEFRTHVEHNEQYRKMFDESNLDQMFDLIEPYLKNISLSYCGSKTCSCVKPIKDILCDLLYNIYYLDTVIIAKTQLEEDLIISLIEALDMFKKVK